MNCRKLISLLLLVQCVLIVQAQTTYEDRIATIHKNIYQYFYDTSAKLFREHNPNRSNDKPHSYLWPLCALIQAANEMEQLQPGKKYMPQVIEAIDQYRSTRSPRPGYDSYVVSEGGGDRFYDDNQWIGLAYMDAFRRTGNQQLLQLSEEIYRFQMGGYDTAAGGGLYWKEKDMTTKNTCSNGPGILLALRLYQATKKQSYLDTALILYNWTKEKLLSPEFVYYDAVKIPGGSLDKRCFTYNTGTMLQSGVLLYAVTKNEKYLKDAQQLAAGSLAYFFKQGRFPGNYWFNAVLLRGYEELYKVDKNKAYIEAFIADTDKIFQTEMDARQLVGRRGVKALIDQAGLLEITARLAWLKKNGF
jgi:predicted alpha-1,6-mannanase (GH76 family)